MRRIISYIYQQPHWPQFDWDNDRLIILLGRVRNLQGKLIGKLETLGFELRNEAVLETLAVEIIKSNEIEGQILNPKQVRSSLASKLGLEVSGLTPSDRYIDGIVEMTLDATGNFSKSLTKKRLYSWHGALFSAGRSGLNQIITGGWRKDKTGPMQVVSGPIGREKVHYQAPDASFIDAEMKSFINWFNSKTNIDPVVKAAIGHLWFVTIHPFEDGNGRIARALTDMLLAKSDGLSQRFYCMSVQIRKDRKQYYDILEKTQKGDLAITAWIEWFLNCLIHSLESSEKQLSKVLFKHQFWSLNRDKLLNSRQIKMVNMLLDGLQGKLTSSKWAKITKCSADTALRDITELIEWHVLEKAKSGGRSTNYMLKKF